MSSARLSADKCGIEDLKEFETEGSLPLYDRALIAQDNCAAEGMEGVAHSHESYAIPVLEIISSRTIGMCFPRFDEKFEVSGDHVVVTLWIRIQVAIEYATDKWQKVFQLKPQANKTYSRIAFPSKQNQGVCMEFEIDVNLHDV